ncbi:hypothetical protein [Nitratireductor aquibiodomus]|uniref:hypothetical protein n=1 Tax=Nitratireductor aquibiodomus TaxID=204799 RepID=UPI0015A69074|nr:hypothetical protein [Nitratireductor aquibiodomus]
MRRDKHRKSGDRLSQKGAGFMVDAGRCLAGGEPCSAAARDATVEAQHDRF